MIRKVETSLIHMINLKIIQHSFKCIFYDFDVRFSRLRTGQTSIIIIHKGKGEAYNIKSYDSEKDIFVRSLLFFVSI